MVLNRGLFVKYEKKNKSLWSQNNHILSETAYQFSSFRFFNAQNAGFNFLNAVK